MIQIFQWMAFWITSQVAWFQNCKNFPHGVARNRLMEAAERIQVRFAL
jgi:hypothetical protein